MNNGSSERVRQRNWLLGKKFVWRDRGPKTGPPAKNNGALMRSWPGEKFPNAVKAILIMETQFKLSRQAVGHMLRSTRDILQLNRLLLVGFALPCTRSDAWAVGRSMGTDVLQLEVITSEWLF
jgi:hypothetical protein